MRETAVNVVVQSPDPRMNAILPPESDAVALVDVIDLKWLLAGEGVHLHVERLQRDPAYARELLDKAARSPNPALPAVAERVRRQLGIDLA
jgi:hypothetical protein